MGFCMVLLNFLLWVMLGQGEQQIIALKILCALQAITTQYSLVEKYCVNVIIVLHHSL